MNSIRKAAAVLLSMMVLFFATISVLAIWDVIKIEKIFQKSISTLFVLFVASAILLFLFSVVFKSQENNSDNDTPRPPKQPPVV
jgi:putative effector of murein hydrolase LrgA (UPF0299 family)